MHIPIENIVTVTVTITNKFGARISAFNVEYYDPTNISSKKNVSACGNAKLLAKIVKLYAENEKMLDITREKIC